MLVELLNRPQTHSKTPQCYQNVIFVFFNLLREGKVKKILDTLRSYEAYAGSICRQSVQHHFQNDNSYEAIYPP